MAKKRKNRSPKLFSFSYRVLLLIFAAALALSYLSVFINPAKLWFPSFFGLYFIPLAFINFLLLIIALLKRSRSAWIPFLILLPTLLIAEYFVKISSGDTVADQSDQLKILTYNVGRFSSNKEETTRDICCRRVVSFVERENPDIVCFQEFCVSDTSTISTIFKSYPFRYYHFFKLRNDLFFGNLTVSKFPIKSGGKITFKGSTNLSLYSDIDCKGKIFRIYNNHLESYNISQTSIIKRIGNHQEDFSSVLLEVHGKMRGTNTKRSEQVSTVLNHVKNSDFLSVVCGDFNDTPMSFTYHKLSQGRKDTFLEAGKGFSSTYSTLWPLLRIDYILVPESFDVHEHKTMRVDYSDHYPVFTSLNMQ